MSTTLQRIRFTTDEIVEMAPIGTAHLLVVTHLAVQLQALHAQMRLLVQQPLIVDQFDEPQPDLVVLREPLGYRKPHVEDCLLVIEVSDSTYATDVAIKLPAYLAAGAPAVWIVNISSHADPVVEAWAPGLRQPTVSRDVVGVAGINVPLSAVFEGLAEIPREEE
jgi:Uma2 family endonuclease